MKTFLIRILTVCICAALLLPATVAVLPAAAEEGMKVAFEESFDDYENGVNATATRLSDYFNVEANAIGDGYVKVEEDGNTGNLYLMSHVFTQVYAREPIKGAYEMSFTTYEMQGGFQSGMFFRGPVCANAVYYEGDAGDDENPNSTGLSGIWLAVYENRMVVTVKAYDENKTHKVINHRFSFNLPEGANYADGIAVRILDDGKTAKILLNETLTCSFVFSEDTGRGWAQNGIDRTVKLLKEVTVLDAEGIELGTVSNTFVSAEESTIGWATRVANMKMDDICILVEDSVEETVPETEPVTEAPTEQPTEAPADAPVETPTEASTDPETTPETDAPTETEAPAASDTTEETGSAASTSEPDDSLAIFILIAVMLVAIGVTAGIVVVNKRKN